MPRLLDLLSESERREFREKRVSVKLKELKQKTERINQIIDSIPKIRLVEKKDSGKVYFIQGNVDSPIKIGYSTNPFERIKQFQPLYKEKLNILLTIEGDLSKEKTIQEFFKDENIHHELFLPSEDLKKYIISQLEKSNQKKWKQIQKNKETIRRLKESINNVGENYIEEHIKKEKEVEKKNE